MHLHVQDIILEEDIQAIRVPITWEALQNASQGHVISWIRNKPTWIEPRPQTGLASHPNLASSIILLKSPDWSTTLAVYPVSTLFVNNNIIVDTSTFPPMVLANARRVRGSEANEAAKVWVVCAQARGRVEERNIIRRVVEEARLLAGGRPRALQSSTQLRDQSSFWDGIGICTWESFGGSSRIPDRPTKDMLLGLVPPFPITTYLIDDGWQDIRVTEAQRRLHSFHAWFGMGADMPAVVSELKEKGVGKIGVWLTLQGYWDGIDPDSPLCERYQCVPHPVAKRDQPRGGVKIPLEVQDGLVQFLPHPSRAAQFWKDWFGEMKSWGVDFVKVDNQAQYDATVSPSATETQQAMWSGMLDAVVEVWGSLERVIMCMSHNERMQNGPGGLDFARPPGNLVFRNSDDYALQYPTAHQDFVYLNIYGAILTEELSFELDFDMFATNPPDHLPTYHALLRALSRGPVLISDTPAFDTDRTLMDKLSAKDRNGRLRSVKADTPCSVLSGRLFWDNLITPYEGPAMVASTGFPDAHGAMLGVWNGHDARSVDKITLSDVEDALGLDDRGLTHEYALWAVGHSQRNGHTVELVGRSWQGGMDILLEKGECEAVVIARVWEVGGHKLAVVGMLDKFACLAGISVRAEPDRLLLRSTFASEALSVLSFNLQGAESVGLSIEVDGTSVEQTPGAGKSKVDIHTICIGGKEDHSPRQEEHKYWEVIVTPHAA